MNILRTSVIQVPANNININIATEVKYISTTSGKAYEVKYCNIAGQCLKSKIYCNEGNSTLIKIVQMPVCESVPSCCVSCLSFTWRASTISVGQCRICASTICASTICVGQHYVQHPYMSVSISHQNVLQHAMQHICVHQLLWEI